MFNQPGTSHLAGDYTVCGEYLEGLLLMPLESFAQCSRAVNEIWHEIAQPVTKLKTNCSVVTVVQCASSGMG